MCGAGFSSLVLQDHQGALLGGRAHAPHPLQMEQKPFRLIYTVGFCTRSLLISKSLCLEVTSLMETLRLTEDETGVQREQVTFTRSHSRPSGGVF